MVKVRSELPEYFVSLGYKVGAEIGVYYGEYNEKFCQVGIFMYAIDPWVTFEECGGKIKPQERYDGIYAHAKKLLSQYDNCKIIRKTSMDAVKDFTDESLDFVYIDGDHGFKGIACDIVEWEKKVRKGGIVAGHDYSGQSCQYVPFVVDAYVKAYKIKNFTTIGGRQYSGSGNRSKSWLWTKE